MARRIKTIGDMFSFPRKKHQLIKTIFLVYTETSTGQVDLDFTDGSITYFDRDIKQSFEYVMIDNIGSGQVRISFNRPGMTLVNPINGAKTLKSGDILHLQNSIRNLSIYFIGSSTIELILITK